MKKIILIVPLILGTLFTSCEKDDEMGRINFIDPSNEITFDQGLPLTQSFDFDQFEPHEFSVNVITNEGVKAGVGVAVFDGPRLIAAGRTDVNGNWSPTIQTDPGMELTVVTPFTTNHMEKLDEYTYKFFIELKGSYSNLIAKDSDDDGVADMGDAFPNDPAISSVNTSRGRILFNDNILGFTDTDYNDGIIDYYVYGYLDKMGQVTLVEMELLTVYDEDPDITKTLDVNLHDISPKEISGVIKQGFGMNPKPQNLGLGYANLKLLEELNQDFNYKHLEQRIVQEGYVDYFDAAFFGGYSRRHMYNENYHVNSAYQLNNYLNKLSSVYQTFNYNAGFTSPMLPDAQNVEALFEESVSSIAFKPQSNDFNIFAGTNLDFVMTTEKFPGARAQLKHFDDQMMDESGMPIMLNTSQEVRLLSEGSYITDKLPGIREWISTRGTIDVEWWK